MKLNKEFFKLNKNKFYQKVFILDKDEYYSALTGEKVNKIKTMKGIIVQKSQTSQSSHSIKEKKAHTPFCYQTRDKKKYIMASQITTNFMRDVLFDYFDTNAVVVKMPSFIIAFFGHNRQEIIKTKGKTEKDIESILGGIYQGLDYKTIEFSNFLSLVKKETKILPIVLLVCSILLVVAVYVNMENEADLEAEQNWKNQMALKEMNKPKSNIITDFKLVGIFNTSELIKGLFNVSLDAGSFVGDFDIGQSRLVIYSLAPMKNSFLKGSFFKRTVRIPTKMQYIKKPFKIRSAKECMALLGKYEDVLMLNSIQNEKIEFSFHDKKMSTDKLSSFFKDIYKCPIVIKEGHVKYVNLENRSVQLHLQLMKQQ